MITVVKCDAHGAPVWTYEGTLIERGPTQLRVRALFNVDDRDDGYFVWQRGDTFIEDYYTDRWYNVFAIFDRQTGALRGWYCNITRPARLLDDRVEWDDLALDVFIWPDGRWMLRDEDDYAALPLTSAERAQAEAAVVDIRRRVANGEEPFRTRAIP